MSARRFSDERTRAKRRLKASDTDILAALEDLLDGDPATRPAIRRLIAERRAWRHISEGPTP